MKKFNKIIANFARPRKWFSVNMAGDEIPEILIYDMIGSSGWEDELSPKAFIQALNECGKKSKKVNLRVNSPGGNVHDAFVIFNAILQSGLEIDAYIDGLAASAAAFVVMACNNVYMPENAEIMIHNAWGYAIGDAEELRKQAAHLDSLTDMIANIYVDKTGKSKEFIMDLMKKETWMNGEEAVELGFADEIIEDAKVAACVFDLDDDILPGLPEGFKRLQNALKKRANEQSLREAGLSRAEAARRASNAALNKKEDITKMANELIKKELKQCLKQ